MTTDQIVELIVSILPSLIAVFTTIGLIVKTIKEFAALKKEVADMKALKDLKEELKVLAAECASQKKENVELKEQMNKLILKMDHIQVK